MIGNSDLKHRARMLFAAGVMTLAIVPLGLATSASAGVPAPLPTAPGAWGTLTMPTDFIPGFGMLNWYGIDAVGNVYYVPNSGNFYFSAPRLRHANVRRSHVCGLGLGIERYTPSTGQSTFIDPCYDFSSGGMTGLAVEPSGAVDLVTWDPNINNFVVMRVDPSGVQTVLNSTIPNLGNPGGIAVDQFGNVFVSTFDFVSGNSTIYEIPAGGGAERTVATLSSDMVFGLAASPDGTIYASAGIGGSGRLYAVTLTGATTPVATQVGPAEGIATDGAGNLFAAIRSSQLVEEMNPSGAPQYLPPSPALTNFGSTSPELLAYGAGTIYMWDQGAQPTSGVHAGGIYSPHILYTWTASTGARPFLTSVDSVAARVVNRYTQSITATWTGGGPTYRCTLMTGFHNPTGFTVLTTAHSCTFYGLALGSSFGISVVSISVGESSAPQVGFAPAPKVTITCKLGTRTLHRSGLSPTCPPGWRLV